MIFTQPVSSLKDRVQAAQFQRQLKAATRTSQLFNNNVAEIKELVDFAKTRLEQAIEEVGGMSIMEMSRSPYISLNGVKAIHHKPLECEKDWSVTVKVLDLQEPEKCWTFRSLLQNYENRRNLIKRDLTETDLSKKHGDIIDNLDINQVDLLKKITSEDLWTLRFRDSSINLSNSEKHVTDIKEIVNNFVEFIKSKDLKVHTDNSIAWRYERELVSYPVSVYATIPGEWFKD